MEFLGHTTEHDHRRRSNGEHREVTHDLGEARVWCSSFDPGIQGFLKIGVSQKGWCPFGLPWIAPKKGSTILRTPHKEPESSRNHCDFYIPLGRALEHDQESGFLPTSPKPAWQFSWSPGKGMIKGFVQPHLGKHTHGGGQGASPGK